MGCAGWLSRLRSAVPDGSVTYGALSRMARSPTERCPGWLGHLRSAQAGVETSTVLSPSALRALEVSTPARPFGSLAADASDQCPWWAPAARRSPAGPVGHAGQPGRRTGGQAGRRAGGQAGRRAGGQQATGDRRQATGDRRQANRSPGPPGGNTTPGIRRKRPRTPHWTRLPAPAKTGSAHPAETMGYGFRTGVEPVPPTLRPEPGIRSSGEAVATMKEPQR